MNTDTTSSVNSKIGNVHICLPQSLRLDNSQITIGVVIQPNGSHKLRKYPSWIKYSPIVSYIHLPYLDMFGYDIDMVFVNPELYGTNPSPVNYVARKLLISHNEINSEYHQSLGPFNEIFLLDNTKKLSINDYIKIMCILHIIPSIDWIASNDIIKAFSINENDPLWIKLADSNNKDYHEIWESRGLILCENTNKLHRLLEVSSDSGYNSDYYDLTDSLIKQFEDFCKDPAFTKLHEHINHIDESDKIINKMIEHPPPKEPDQVAIPKLPEQRKLLTVPNIDRSSSELPKLLTVPTICDSSKIVNNNGSSVAPKLNAANPLVLNRRQKRGLSKKTRGNK